MSANLGQELRQIAMGAKEAYDASVKESLADFIQRIIPTAKRAAQRAERKLTFNYIRTNPLQKDQRFEVYLEQPLTPKIQIIETSIYPPEWTRYINNYGLYMTDLGEGNFVISW